MEMIVSVVVDLITDPIKQYIVTPIKQHVSYAFTCDSKVQKLCSDMEQLQNKRDRLQQSVDEASRNGEQIYPNVTEWLTTAEKDIEEAEKLIQGKEEAKQKCCVGICPNLKTRYQLSKKADKKASAMEQLQNAQGLDPIAFRPPPQPIVERSMYSREALPSRVLILNHIMDALKDPNLNTIGVYGMGGVGKTTLAKEVLRQAVEQKLFVTVVLVAVSETPDVRRIQGEIADALGFEFHAEEIPGRASQLHQRLNKEKALIILDDVWQKLDLNAVGISVGDACQGCKILLTSRRKEVLSSEMFTQKEFPLNILEEEETWRLFEMSVSMANNLELRALAIEVAKRCAGLPLLIKKVATDLRNKNAYAWKDMLKQLSVSENTEIYDKVHKVIESSYEKMIDEEAKSLFLLCALFGSSNIQIHDLLIYCMGLGLFKHADSIEGSRNRMLTLIDKLKDESLLLDADKAGYVKIHDVVRDIAVAIASRVQHAFVGTSKVRSTDLRNKDVTRISIPYCAISELPEVLECPETEVFSLLAVDLSLDIPNSFFERVTKLKVLHFSGMSFESGLPSSLGFLTGLQTLSLQGCQFNNVAIISELKQLECLSFAGSSIAELPLEIKGLTQLKLLDLRGCRELQVIPPNVLSNLSLLEELYMLYSFEGWGREGNASLVELKNLSCLTTLEIKVKDDKLLPENWFFDGIQNYKIIIGYWASFHFDLMEMSNVLMLELKTSFGLMDRIKEFLAGTEVLYLRVVKGIENLLYDSSMERINSFQRLRFLNIEKCDLLREVLPFSSEKCLPHLQEMEMKYCSNIEAIFGEGNEDEVMEFTELTSLKLWFLPHLRGVCRTNGTVSFPNLTSFDLFECKSLKYVFTTSMVKSLKQLKKFQINGCELLEEIVLGKAFEEIEEDSTNKIVFPELDVLKLSGLSNLKRFSSGYPVEFAKLRELKIESCHEMKNFVWEDSDRSNNNESSDECLFNELVTFPNLEIMLLGSMKNLRYIWHQQFADNDSFAKLKSLEIKNCSKPSVVFASNYAYGRFQRLKSLTLSRCDGVEEIFEYKESKDMDEAFGFQNLQSLELHGCPELKHVFPESIACGLLQFEQLVITNSGVEMIISENEGSEGVSARTFKWPNFKRLIIYDCHKFIKFTSTISMAKHNIPTQRSLNFVEKVIPNLEFLALNHHSLKAIQSDDHGFPNEVLWKLKEVTLRNLQEESLPFLFDFLKRNYYLEKLNFNKGHLGEIFSLHDERATGDQERQYHLRLKQLKLQNVSELQHIVKEDSLLNPILLRLDTLHVTLCDDMLNIAPSSVSFKNLTTLNVSKCVEMTSLVTASTAKSMTQLKKLRVSECRAMEEIIANDGNCTEGHGDVITFSNLKDLELYGLFSLNSFCSGDYMFNLPLLEQVSIEHCFEMKVFCDGILNAPKLHQRELFGNGQRWKEI